MMMKKLFLPILIGVLMNAQADRQAAAGGQDSSGLSPLSVDLTDCNGEPVIPACASWIWSLCYFRQESDLCAKIGLRDIVFIKKLGKKEGKPQVPPELVGRLGFNFPRLAKMVRGGPKEGRIQQPGVILFDTLYGDDEYEMLILGVRQVSPDRFEPARQWLITGQKFADVVGTHEVMIGPSMGQSEFYRKVGDRWLLTSWTIEGASCGGDDPDADLYAECYKYISIRDWQDQLRSTPGFVEKSMNWKADDYIRFFNQRN